MNIAERDKHYARKFRQEKPLAVKAHNKVANAVYAGRIPRADSRVCVDCGGRAYCYDHRDYTKPLEVEPVCGGCNKKRGPAHPYTNPLAGSTPSASPPGCPSSGPAENGHFDLLHPTHGQGLRGAMLRRDPGGVPCSGPLSDGGAG